jgi:hypothetical protein
MAGFLYFLPHCQGLSPKDFERVGLAHALDRQFKAAPVVRGPDGNPGLVVSADNVPSVGYFPGTQTWQKAPGQPWMVGTINGHEPTPQDLERGTIVECREVELVDGRTWKLPVARQFQEPETWGEGIPFYWRLPRSLGLSDQGEWLEKEVIPKYADLWKLAIDWSAWTAQEMDEEQMARFTFDGQVDAAVQCLAVHYRIGRVEAALLGLLTIELAREVLDVLIDLERFLVLAKKKQAALRMASGLPGSEGS